MLLSGSNRMDGGRITLAHTYVILDAVRDELRKIGTDVGLIVTMGGEGFETTGVKWAHRYGIPTLKGTLAPAGPNMHRENTVRAQLTQMLAPDLIVVMGKRRECKRTVYLGNKLGIPTLNVPKLPPAEIVAQRAKSISRYAGAVRRADARNRRVHEGSGEPGSGPLRSRNGRFVAKDSAP